jgi:phosphoserine phosphatase
MSAKAAEFIQSVLQLKPKLAVFDCDGTLWAGDAGEGFFDWELQRGIVSQEMVRWARARYAEYQAGKVSEDDMCSDMVTVNRGLPEAEVLRASVQYFDENMARQIFPEMKELVLRLHDLRCDVWAVSSTSDWGIQAGMRHFNIPPDRIIAAAAVVENGTITDKVVRVPSGKGKPQAIHDVIGRIPDAVFGNSIWDADMLEIARHPFVINSTPQLQAIARERRWPVYQPDLIPTS